MNGERTKVWQMLNWPNRISLLRLLLIGPFVVLLLNAEGTAHWSRWGAFAIFVIMAVSDFIDGQLARRLDQRTRLGAILDPLADKALIICSVVLLSLESVVPPPYAIPSWVVVAVVGKDLWVLGGFLVLYLATNRFKVQPSWPGKLATATQLVMVIVVLLAPSIESVLGSELIGSLTFGLFLLVTAMSIAAVVSYTRMGLGFILQRQQPITEADSERGLSDAIGEAFKSQDESD
jgi:cardiolipin synthase